MKLPEKVNRFFLFTVWDPAQEIGKRNTIFIKKIPDYHFRPKEVIEMKVGYIQSAPIFGEKQANFSSKPKRTKLAAFRAQLKKANDNNEVSKGDVYLFLNHFHLLGYDLGKEVGVVLSLLHSHISQFNIDSPSWAWGRIVDVVQTWNQDAGTITPEKIPEDLREAFKQRVYEVIPNEFSAAQLPSDKPDWNQHGYASDLVIANLLGAWNEKNAADL